MLATVNYDSTGWAGLVEKPRVGIARMTPVETCREGNTNTGISF